MLSEYILFAEIVRNGSLSAAGRKLRLSPATISKRLARLEARLGVQLLHRTTRRLALTPTGQRFHEDVVSILSAIKSAEARVEGRDKSVKTPLRVTAPTSFGRLHIAPHLKSFLETHPHIELQIDLADGFSDLVSEHIHLAIRISSEIAPTLTAHRLGTSSRILCASQDYLTEHGTPVSIEELDSHHLLAATGQFPWRLQGPNGPLTVHGKSYVRTNSSEVVRELTVAGVGISLRSLWDINRELEDDRLQRLLPQYEGSIDVGIYAVHPRASLVPTPVTEFITHLKTIYAVLGSDILGIPKRGEF